MINKINLYVIIQILKSCTLVFFIFLTISWLLQLTRLLTLTNFIQIDILNVIYLSTFLIPNLLTIIIPFIVIFGLLLCFIKLNRDKELIAIYSLGLQIKPIKYSLYFFGLILFIFYTTLNFYVSPKIYEIYKIKEFELRNTINFDKMIVSNFLKLNKSTTIDFKRKNNIFEDIFISFTEDKENLIFAKNGFIKNDFDKYIFQLNEGFKLSINNENEIEKLEFENYLLTIKNENSIEFNNYDRNTFTIIDDIKNKNYLNISYKFTDLMIVVFILYLFYQNNILNFNFDLKNNMFFIIFSILLLIMNQLIKNSEINLNLYFLIIFLTSASIIFLSKFKSKYE